jgi:hypothetical protein
VISLPDVRNGIAAILEGVPELRRVNPLEQPGENVNNLPCAYVHRGTINRPPITLFGEGVGLEGLGQNSQLVEWDISIYAALNGYGSAQELDDVFAARLIDAFDGNRLIDPNGPGVVDVSKLHQLTAFTQLEDNPALWVTQALVNTLIIQ